ncbi:hypothetical protein BS50DRAFT_567520 [Corynespora cassiicola Philippines]|uniref:Uncharacterized protein n=1 Tax=Corynespora cassiicola Philippines TaxID=1448308 RepID=A0A2T2PAP0_CORCC|nr:hypothetical protein BS50DRAFT_567520 [Corynespora cassiicola Philippines]
MLPLETLAPYLFISFVLLYPLYKFATRPSAPLSSSTRHHPQTPPIPTLSQNAAGIIRTLEHVARHTTPHGRPSADAQMAQCALEAISAEAELALRGRQRQRQRQRQQQQQQQHQRGCRVVYPQQAFVGLDAYDVAPLGFDVPLHGGGGEEEEGGKAPLWVRGQGMRGRRGRAEYMVGNDGRQRQQKQQQMSDRGFEEDERRGADAYREASTPEAQGEEESYVQRQDAGQQQQQQQQQQPVPLQAASERQYSARCETVGSQSTAFSSLAPIRPAGGVAAPPPPSPPPPPPPPSADQSLTTLHPYSWLPPLTPRIDEEDDAMHTSDDEDDEEFNSHDEAAYFEYRRGGMGELSSPRFAEGGAREGVPRRDDGIPGIPERERERERIPRIPETQRERTPGGLGRGGIPRVPGGRRWPSRAMRRGKRMERMEGDSF